MKVCSVKQVATVDPGFLRMCKDYGMPRKAGSGRWRRSFWNEGKEQETEMEENMPRRLY